MRRFERSPFRFSVFGFIRRGLTLGLLAVLLCSSLLAQAAPSDPFGGAASSFTAPPGEIVDFNVGDWGVSQQQGAATYTFPIAMPPGRSGMAPSLVLRYSSQAPLRGGVAAGWTLDIPTIEKDLSLGADAGDHYRVTMPEASGRLVEVPDDLPYTDAAAAYRVDFDASFTRFFRRTQQVEFKTHSYWTALSPDGMRHYFENDKQASDRRSRWMLTRQEDAFGNTIEYFYSFVASPLSAFQVIDYRLDRIEYTSNRGAGLAAHAKVELAYAPIEVCSNAGIPIGAAPIRGSSQVSGAQRLTGIKTYVRDTPGGNWRLSRSTTLTIKLGGSVLHEPVTFPDPPPPDIYCTQNPLRYLDRIDVTAFDRQGAATVLPPMRFFYNKRINTTLPISFPNPDPMAAKEVAVDGPFQAGDVHGLQMTLLDLNSDGLRDQVRVEERGGTCTLLWRKGLPGGTFADVEKASPLPTVAWYNGAEREENEFCTLNGQIAYHKGALVGTKGIVGYHFMDYTGDGRLDLVTSVWATGDIETYVPPTLLPSASMRSLQGGNALPIPDPGTISSTPMVPEPDGSIHYRWRVYRNAAEPGALLPGADLSDIMFSATYFNVKAPLPLAPTTAEAKIDTNVMPNYSIPPLIDIDGDGFLDMINPRRDPDDPGTKNMLLGQSDWTVYFGDGSSTFPSLVDTAQWIVPRFTLSIPGNGINEEPGGGASDPQCRTGIYVHNKSTIAALDDFNGDGLADLIVNGNDSLIYPYPNTGSSFALGAGFTPRQPLEVQQTDCLGNVIGGGSFLDGQRGYSRRMVDLDGDGLQDVVFLSGGANNIAGDASVFARFNLGDRYGPQVRLPDAWLPVRRLLTARNGDWGIASDFTDVSGDGLADLVEWDQSSMTVIESPGLRPAPDLLTAVMNGRGLRVEFDYAPSTDGVTVQCADATCANHTLPYVTWVVSETRVDPGSGPLRTEYTYYDAQFLSRSAYTGIPERASFAGFARTDRLVRDANGVAQQQTRSHYGHQALNRQHGPTDPPVVAAPNGHLQEEFTYVMQNGQAKLHSYKQSTVEHSYLFTGQVQVTLPVATTSCVTETPGGSVADCLARTSNVVHTESTWVGMAPSTVNDPPVNCGTPPCVGPPPELFVQSGAVKSSGDGKLVRRTETAYDIRYGQPWPQCNLLPCTQPPDPAADDYRVQVRETERLVKGVGGSFQTTSLSTVGYDFVTGLPLRTRDFLDATVFAETQFEHDPATGNLLAMRKPVQNPAQGGSGAKTTFVYGPHKLFISQTTDELGFQVFTDYDVATGVLISRKGPNARLEPNGQSEKLEEQRWTLDGFGRVLSYSATYDELKKGELRYTLHEVVRYTYEDLNEFNSGEPVAKREERLLDVGGSIWVQSRRTYDGLGRVLQGIQTIDAAAESVTTFVYDAQGNLARVIMPDPRDDTQTVTFTYTYDSLNRMLRSTRPDNSANGISYLYTGQSRTVQEETSDGSGASRTEFYDAFGRLAELHEFNPDTQTAITRYSYDANDNLARIVDADGNVTELEHDRVGNRLAVTRTGRTWRYEYDRNGNLVASISPRPAGAAEDDYTVRNTYDDLDRLVQVQFTDRHISQAPTPTPTNTPTPTGTPTPTSTPTGGSTDTQIFLPSVSQSSSQRSNAASSPAQADTERPVAGAESPLAIDPTAPWLVSQYDLTAAVSVMRYIYDEGDNGIGRMVRVELPFGQVRYNYDPRGLITGEERTVVVSGSVSVNAVQSVERSYNALGQLTLSTWDDGQQWRISYDERGLVERVDWFDPQAADWRSVAGYTRNALGLPVQRDTDYGQTRTFAYDVLSRVVDDQIAANGQPVAARTYNFTDAGDLAQVGGQTNGASAAAAYSYDPQHRLLTASGPNGYTAAFAYSAAGNVLNASVAWNGSTESRDVQYEYGQTDPQAVDRLVNSQGGDAYAAFDYAPSGNMTWRRTPDGDTLLHWNGLEQVRLVETSSGSETYYYDHTGARILAMNPSTGVRFWFAESETHYDIAGSQTERYLHLAAGGPALARVSNGSAVELQYADALQNLMLALDSAGDLAARFFYGAFGEVVDESGADDHRRQFNGKESDVVSGLRYYGYRYYDPLLLRWNSADPLYRFMPDISLEDPQRINLYAFSLNNPVRYYDPDGRYIVPSDPDDPWYGKCRQVNTLCNNDNNDDNGDKTADTGSDATTGKDVAGCDPQYANCELDELKDLKQRREDLKKNIEATGQIKDEVTNGRKRLEKLIAKGLNDAGETDENNRDLRAGAGGAVGVIGCAVLSGGTCLAVAAVGALGDLVLENAFYGGPELSFEVALDIRDTEKVIDESEKLVNESLIRDTARLVATEINIWRLEQSTAQ